MDQPPIMNTVPFAVYYAGDAYSTAGKIMGRQSAGKSFMRGMARSWEQHALHGVGQGARTMEAMAGQLRADGFSGQLVWHEQLQWQGTPGAGCLYYPAPPARDLAFARNMFNPAAFSLMGVTHTLSSAGTMDELSELVLPPFQSWDALICTSRAALQFTTEMHAEMKAWMAGQTGASRFAEPQLPVIPLGVDCPAFAPLDGAREVARAALEVDADEVVFLFAGRLSFHAKCNPAAMYQALEQAARHARVVCVEAGIFPNQLIQQSFLEAQRTLAPSVRFLWADGSDSLRYQHAWQGADVFVSLSDNIQETFGLTPVEAMAACLPVVVSDWNGYMDTVRDGVDGYRIRTILPPAGAGADLALRHAIGADPYDYYIGRASLATVVEPAALAAALTRLAAEPQLRHAMGAAGLQRAREMFDWPVILRQYAALAGELGSIRQAAGAQAAQPWIARGDPFARFAHFASAQLQGDWQVLVKAEAMARLRDLLQLSMTNYAFDAQVLPPAALEALLAAAARMERPTVQATLAAAGVATAPGARALMWLWKFDLIHVQAA